MDVNEHKPYRSLTARRDAERRYAGPSADGEACRTNPKSYSSSETLKAFDQDARLAYGGLVKERVHQEVEEFSRHGADFSLRELGFSEAMPPHMMGYRTDPMLAHRGFTLGAGGSSDADTETDGVGSPDHAARLWGRSTKSGRSSCMSSRANSNLTLTDTEHENTENEGAFQNPSRLRTPPLPLSHSHTPSQHHVASASSLNRGNYTPRSNPSPTPTDGSVPPEGPASAQESGSAQDNWLLNSNIPLETRYLRPDWQYLPEVQL